jgi:ferredoxin-NADP reductase
VKENDDEFLFRGRVTLVVTERHTSARDVMTLTLQREAGGELEPWSPGAHVDLILTPGLERRYSLCGDPKQPDRWRVAVLREPNGRGGSAYLHDKLEIGDSVTVRGTRNHFRFESAPRYLFVAGGIGITPILPMIADAQHACADWQFWYGGRSDDSMGFREELAMYGDRVQFWPQDKKGLLPLDDILGSVGDDTLVYCCGPESLLLAVEERSARWPDEVLHVERFSPEDELVLDV